MNVGASAPEEAGQYFSWGNTVGHTPGDGYEFTETAYNNTPGAEVSGQLPLANDAARVNMGGSWKTPTKTQVQELVANCTYLWTQRNGVYGALLTSNINGNTLFIPAHGYWVFNEVSGDTEYAYGLVNSLMDQDNCYCVYADSDAMSDDSSQSRWAGLPVRAVQD